MDNTPIQPMILQLINLAKGMIIPIMASGFAFTLLGRCLIFYTVAREETFAKEFEKRVKQYLDNVPESETRSFFVIANKLLAKTFYEMFEKRSIMRRRKLDYVLAPSDRIFLIQQGSARLVRDTLREIRYLRYDGNPPPLLEIVKDVLAQNPCFTKVLGIFPIGPLNDMLNLIPGLFIVGGIFGTFLGIMQALPELGAMDLRDPDSTKLVMDTFWARAAFSMGSSTIGIGLSVLSTIFNNFVAPEKLFIRSVDLYERSLFRIWIRCQNNQLPEQIPGFDENRDALDALADLAVDKELSKLAEYQRGPKSPAAAPPGVPGAPPMVKKAS